MSLVHGRFQRCFEVWQKVSQAECILVKGTSLPAGLLFCELWL